MKEGRRGLESWGGFEEPTVQTSFYSQLVYVILCSDFDPVFNIWSTQLRKRREGVEPRWTLRTHPCTPG